MKKLLLTVMVFLLMTAPAWAATYPVYVDDNEIGQAQVKNGVTYLPMRTVFEILGLDVEWRPATKQIVATEGERSYVMRLGQTKVAEYYAGEEVGDGYIMSAAPYAVNGRVFLPLRAVGEMLYREVFWLQEQKCVMIEPGDSIRMSASYDDWSMNWLIMPSGNIYDCDMEKHLIKLAEIDGWHWQPDGITGTDGGNYVLSVEYSKDGEAARYANIWLDARTGVSRTVWTEGKTNGYWRSAHSGDGVVWVFGVNRAYVLDDKNGDLLKNFDLRQLLGCQADVHMAWAHYSAMNLVDTALIFDETCTHWGVLDWRTEKLTDISDKILTAEVKQRFNEKLWQYVREMPEAKQYDSKEAFLATFWQNLRETRYDASPNANPCLVLKGEMPDNAKDGVLYFRLSLMTDVYNQRYSELIEWE